MAKKKMPFLFKLLASLVIIPAVFVGAIALFLLYMAVFHPPKYETQVMVGDKLFTAPEGWGRGYVDYIVLGEWKPEGSYNMLRIHADLYSDELKQVRPSSETYHKLITIRVTPFDRDSRFEWNLQKVKESELIRCGDGIQNQKPVLLCRYNQKYGSKDKKLRGKIRDIFYTVQDKVSGQYISVIDCMPRSSVPVNRLCTGNIPILDTLNIYYYYVNENLEHILEVDQKARDIVMQFYTPPSVAEKQDHELHIE